MGREKDTEAPPKAEARNTRADRDRRKVWEEKTVVQNGNRYEVVDPKKIAIPLVVVCSLVYCGLVVVGKVMDYKTEQVIMQQQIKQIHIDMIKNKESLDGKIHQNKSDIEKLECALNRNCGG